VHVLQDQGGGLLETLCSLEVLLSFPVNTYIDCLPKTSEPPATDIISLFTVWTLEGYELVMPSAVACSTQ
jgi:hypothetical protein